MGCGWSKSNFFFKLVYVAGLLWMQQNYNAKYLGKFVCKKYLLFLKGETFYFFS